MIGLLLVGALVSATPLMPAQDGARKSILEKLRAGDASSPGGATGRVLLDGDPPAAPAPIQAQTAPTPVLEPEPSGEFIDDVRCWLELEPAEVEIGQPIECTLNVVYPPGVRVRITEKALQLDDTWVVLDAGRVLSTDEGDERRTRASWKVISLEPGERLVQLSEGRYEAWGTLHGLDPEPALVRVLPALAEGEDEPRPAAGFREPADGAELSLLPLWIAAGIFGSAMLITAFVALRARRRKDAGPAPLGARARLARIDAAGFDDPQQVRATWFELCAILRDLVDARGERARRGATDEEWLAEAAHDVGLPTELHEELEAFFAQAERVKYGGERPTRWAAEEALKQARALAERLAQAPSRPVEVGT